MSYINSIQQFMQPINNSPYLAGITMLMLNIGSKYVELGFSATQEQALKAGLAREILIFSLVFMATKDIIISILMTAAFIILADYLLNDKSKLCIIPEKLKQISLEIDLNHDNHISEEEERRAIEILKKANEQHKHKQQSMFLSNLGSVIA